MVQRQGCLRYDYFDGTDNIKEAERDSHGMHVTGIATGNLIKKQGNGEKIYGVAPEAQVMFMRVSFRSSKQQDLLFM